MSLAEEANQCKFCNWAINNPEGIVGEVCCRSCDENYEYISPLGKNELPIVETLPRKGVTEETPKQIATRQAYTKHKAKNAPSAPYVGLRDGEIEEIAGKALAQMKPWWQR